MSADDTTPTSTPSSHAITPPGDNQFAKLEPFAVKEEVSRDKLYSLIKKGELPVYRLPNVKGVCVKVTEARAIVARLAAQGKIRRGYGSFGPDAVVRDLSNVAGQSFEVDQ